ncbi:MAG: 2Fe-2S iron-sulfur cluster-binding protein, partial [Acidimicrobiia bacterium]
MSAVRLKIDDIEVVMPDGTTLLEACRSIGRDQPTLCYSESLTPVNVCRVCVVEVEGSRALVPSCSRVVEDGMVVATDSDRVRHSRKMVLELLASATDVSLCASEVIEWIEDHGADPARYGPAAPAGERDALRPGHHLASDGLSAETVAQAIKI